MRIRDDFGFSDQIKADLFGIDYVQQRSSGNDARQWLWRFGGEGAVREKAEMKRKFWFSKKGKMLVVVLMAGFEIFRGMFVFFYFKLTESLICNFFNTCVNFLLDLKTPYGCWVGVSKTTYTFSCLWPSSGEIIIYTRRTVNMILPNQWDDVIYAKVCVSFLISTRG